MLKINQLNSGGVVAIALIIQTLEVSQPIAAQTTFPDIQNHWAKTCIQQLTNQQIIAGYPDGNFRPDGLVTRAEFAALLRKAFPNTSPIRTAIAFNDVPANFWANNAIRTAYETNFLSGYPGNLFKPSEQIPRVQVLVSLASGLKYSPTQLPPVTLNAVFDDAIAIPNYALSGIAAATEKNLVVNYPNVRSLNPNRQATRGEVSAFLCQAIAPPLPTGTVSEQYIVQTPIVAGKSWTNAQQLQVLELNHNQFDPRYTAGCPIDITARAISPNGQMVALGSYSYAQGCGGVSSLAVWNLETKAQMRVFWQGTLDNTTSEPNQVSAIAFSGDNQILAAGFTDNRIQLWNRQTGEIIYTLTGHSDRITDLKFTPNNQTLISASADSTIKLWNISTGQIFRTFPAHRDGVATLAMSSDGVTLASGGSGFYEGEDKTIKLWNIGSGQLLHTLNAHERGGGKIFFSPDGKTLITTCGAGPDYCDRALKFWQVSTAKLIEFGSDRAYQSHRNLFLSPDWQTIAGILVDAENPGSLRLWNAQTGNEIRSFSGNTDYFTFSANGQTLIKEERSDVDGITIEVWR